MEAGRTRCGTRTVRFTSPGVELDPGGIGKGFAVDAAVKALRAEGVHAALLSAGSSTIYGMGAPPDESGWKVRVPDPERAGAAISTIVLHDTSLSTANCSEKHFVLSGHLYCHIMDPRTLRPVQGRLQATVIAPSATDSDALSNAMFVLDAHGAGRLNALAARYGCGAGGACRRGAGEISLDGAVMSSRRQVAGASPGYDT